LVTAKQGNLHVINSRGR